jgi:hypothetical protein
MVLAGAIIAAAVASSAFLSMRHAEAVWPAGQAALEAPAPGLPPDPEAWTRLLELIEAMPADLDITFVQDSLAGAGPPGRTEIDWDRLEPAMLAMDRLVEGGGLVPPPATLTEESPAYVRILEVARLRLLRAWSYAQEDRDAEALAEMLRVERLGLLLEQAGGNLLVTMVGVAVEEAALDEILDLLATRPGVPSQALIAVQAELEAGLALPNSLPGAIAAECRMMESTYDEMRHWDRDSLFAAARPGVAAAPQTTSGENCCPPFYDPDRTIQLHRWRCARLVAAAADPDYVWPTFETLFVRGSLEPGQYLDNPVGRVLLDISAPSFAPHADKLERLRRRKALAVVRVALRRYELHQPDGGLPATLADLVPAYLAAVPDGLGYEPGARRLTVSAGAEVLTVEW